MIAREKREWFELDKPIGEPLIAETWREEPYWIERSVTNEGEHIWFGQAVNWRSVDGIKWQVLGEDENVKPTVFIPGTDGMGDYYEYPEGRQIWIDCEMPIYEKMYLEISAKKG